MSQAKMTFPERDLVLQIALFLLVLARWGTALPAQGAERRTTAASCLQSSVRTIERPFFPGEPASPLFRFSFRLEMPTAPGAPVVVYLPGGPGQTGIDASRQGLGIPRAFGFLTIDPRGTGCNAVDLPPGREPAAFYGTLFHAQDVAAAVASLSKPDFPPVILYGISYGTEVATMTETLLPLNLKPKVVVLEGTLGRAFRSQAEIYSGFLGQWKQTKAALPEDVQEALNENAPLGISGEKWANFIEDTLPLGVLSGGRTHLGRLLQGLSRDASDSEKRTLRQSLQRAGSEFPGPSLEYYRHINCTEIAADVTGSMHDFVLVKGDLVLRPEHFCAQRALARPFDSAVFQSSSPVVYFSGGRDPATPPWQARYHFDHQRTTRKALVVVPDAGHNPLVINLRDCQARVWGGIANFARLGNGAERRMEEETDTSLVSGLRQTLAGCALKSEVITPTLHSSL